MCMPVPCFLICTDTLICELGLSAHVPIGFQVNLLTLNMFQLAKLLLLSCFSLIRASPVESGLSTKLTQLGVFAYITLVEQFSRLLYLNRIPV